MSPPMKEEYERRLELLRNELHKKYDRYESRPRSHEDYNIWLSQFDGNGKSEWDKYWLDKMDEGYHAELIEIKRNLIDELERESRERDRDSHSQLQSQTRDAQPKDPVKESLSMPPITTQPQLMNVQTYPQIFDHRNVTASKPRLSSDLLEIHRVKTDHQTQTENEQSIPLSQVREIISNFKREVHRAVQTAENDFKFHNGFDEPHRNLVIPSDPTRGYHRLPDKVDKLLRLQMTTSKHILAHALKVQNEAIKKEVNRIEIRFDKMLPYCAQKQRHGRTPDMKRAVVNECGNKDEESKRVKFMEPQARSYMNNQGTPGRASSRFSIDTTKPRFDRFHRQTIGDVYTRHHLPLRRSSVFVEPPKKLPARPARRMTICEKAFKDDDLHLPEDN